MSNIKLGPEGAWYRSAAWKIQRTRIIKRDQGNCRWCGRPGARSVQHLIPLRKWKASGGQADQYPDSYLVLLCAPCHGRADGQRRY